MRKHFKHYFIIFAVVLCAMVAQNVFAETVVQTITGVIESISTTPNSIVVDGIEIYGIRINYLAKYGVDIYELEADQSEVSVLAYEYECANGTIELMAAELTAGDVTITLRPIP